MTPVSSDSEFRMIQDLPVLENYDVLTSLDALAQPVGHRASPCRKRIKRQNLRAEFLSLGIFGTNVLE